jgi:hypothetical protein
MEDQDQYGALLGGLEWLEHEARSLRTELESPTGKRQRDEALVKAVRLWANIQLTGPVAVSPGAGSASSSSGNKVATNCPKCKHSLTITLT